MSVGKAKEFLAAVKEKTPDEGFREKAAAKIGEEKIGFVVDMAHEMGYDVTEADIREAIAQVQQKDFVVVDDGMLEDVAGGKINKIKHINSVDGCGLLQTIIDFFEEFFH